MGPYLVSSSMLGSAIGGSCLAAFGGGLAALWIQLGALAFVGALVWHFRNKKRFAGPRPASIPLTPQHAVHIVDAGDVRLIVGTGPGAAPRLLCQMPAADPAPAPTAERTESSA